VRRNEQHKKKKGEGVKGLKTITGGSCRSKKKPRNDERCPFEKVTGKKEEKRKGAEKGCSFPPQTLGENREKSENRTGKTRRKNGKKKGEEQKRKRGIKGRTHFEGSITQHWGEWNAWDTPKVKEKKT